MTNFIGIEYGRGATANIVDGGPALGPRAIHFCIRPCICAAQLQYLFYQSVDFRLILGVYLGQFSTAIASVVCGFFHAGNIHSYKLCNLPDSVMKAMFLSQKRWRFLPRVRHCLNNWRRHAHCAMLRCVRWCALQHGAWNYLWMLFLFVAVQRALCYMLVRHFVPVMSWLLWCFLVLHCVHLCAQQHGVVPTVALFL